MGFEYPPGEPGPIKTAAGTLGRISGDLTGQSKSTKTGFAQALASWKGKRSDDFREASGGLQLSVRTAQSAADNAATALHAYAKALSRARSEIDHLKGQEHARQQRVSTETSGKPAQDPDVIRAHHACASYVAGLEGQAEEERKKARTAARTAAALIRSQTDKIVPNSTKLSPAEIARQVHQVSGVTGIQQEIDSGRLTGNDAWDALRNSEKALNKDDVNKDGSLDWVKIKEDLSKGDEKLQDGWALGTSPAAGYALARLGLAAKEEFLARKELTVSMRALLPEWAQKGVKMDAPGRPGSLEDVCDDIDKSMRWGSANDTAVESLIKAENSGKKLSGAVESLARNGLPKWAEVLGDDVGLLGYLADFNTLRDPNAAIDDKVDAGLNATGLGMLKTGKPTVQALAKGARWLRSAPAAASDAGDVGAFAADAGEGASALELAEGGTELAGIAAADATVGWVPIVGWGLVAVTAGYEVYKHWDSVCSAAKATWHGVTSVTHWVGSHLPHIHVHLW